MSDSIAVVSADDEDLTYFAHRRTNDEESARLYRELAQSAPGGAHVVRDAGTPIGIAFAHAMEDEWFLSEIFVEPSFRGNGIGFALLRAAAAGAGDVLRAGLLSAADPPGIAFYVRRGVALQTPVISVRGEIPHRNEILRMAAGDYRFSTEPLDLTLHRAAVAQLDREVRGTARPLDHPLFLRSAYGVAFRRDAEIAGYAYVWQSGRVGPLVTASAAYAVQFFAFALAAVQERFGASWCTALIAGENVRVARAAASAGLTIDRVLLFAADPAPRDLSRYIGFHDLLF